MVWLLSLLALSYQPKNRPYDVQHYDLVTRIDMPSGRFVTDETITLTSHAVQTELRLDAVKLLVQSVEVDGKSANFKLSAPASDEDAGELVVAVSLQDKQQAKVHVVFSGQATSSQNGAFLVTDPDDSERGPIFATTFEATAARRFFVCNDEPYDKATTRITIVAPAGQQGLANGLRTPPVIPLEDGKSITTYVMDKPLAPYLVTVAVGKFDESKDKTGRLEYYLDPKKVARAQPLKDSTTHAIDFLAKYLGVPYAYPVYRQISVPTFRWSGMENTTTTVMKASRILPNDPNTPNEHSQVYALVAHELAHQWFGDLVTNAWWNDVWLNEAFASFLEGRAGRDYFKNELADLDDFAAFQVSYLRDESSALGHPIVQQELPSPNDAFDGISYTKGALVLRTLATYLGEERFRAGLKKYLERHAHSTATSADLFAAMSDASGENLEAFAKVWLYERGYPQLQVEQSFAPSAPKAAAGRLVLKVTQSASNASATLYPMRIPVVAHRRTAPAFDVPMVIDFSAGPVKALQKTVSVETALEAAPEWVTIDPEFGVLAEVVKRTDASRHYAQIVQSDPKPMARLMAMRALARPWFVNPKAATLIGLGRQDESTLVTALAADKSPFVQATFLDMLSSLQAARFPAGLSPVVRGLYASTGDGSLGHTLRRVAAAGVLGRMNDADSNALIAKSLVDTTLSIDLLRPLAMSAAKHKDGLAWLRAAQKAQAKRGYVYRIVLLEALASIPSAVVVDDVYQAVLKSANDGDAFHQLIKRIHTNSGLTQTGPGAKMIGALVLRPEFDEEQRSDLLQTLAGAKSKEVKTMLTALTSSEVSPRCKEMIQKLLAAY